MPVGFLTESQRAQYGRFNSVPDPEQLAGFFHLDAPARAEAMACRGARAQVGYAVQLGTVRFLGTFLADPSAVPVAVVDYVAAQLGLAADDLKGYGESEARWVLLDYSDLVVHIQHAEERAYYALERLWSDCPVVDLP